MTDSGSISVDGKIYIVTYTHDHVTLKVGDRVQMKRMKNGIVALMRVTDRTFHHRNGQRGQFVHLEEVKP